MQKPWEIDIQIYDDEEELLDGLQRGERMACTCMLKRFASRLYRVAFQLMGHADEAEDVLQESFIQACKHVADFERRSGLGTWLHRIVVNTALMRLRRKQLKTVELHEQPNDEQRTLPNALVDPLAPDHTVLGKELRHQIEHALLALPDSLRAAFVLREIEGLSTKEAALALDISESALKVRLHRARQALRSQLLPYLEAVAFSEGDLSS